MLIRGQGLARRPVELGGAAATATATATSIATADAVCAERASKGVT
jgi:hypothetical protein